MTPGGIEASEARGQQHLCQSSQLPREIKLVSYDDLEKSWGLTVQQPTAGDDELFYTVSLPAGWTMKPTEHSMHNSLFDDKGRKRASVFYKAAFYDRKAFMTVLPRYRVDFKSADKECQMTVVDSQTEEQLFDSGPMGYSEASKAAYGFIAEHFPDKSPLAYWEK